MLVEDIMIKAVRTIGPDEAIRKAAAIICTNKISGVPVVDDQDNLLGIISEKDILKTLLPSFSEYIDDPIRSRDFEKMEECYSELLTKPVKFIMTEKVYTIDGSDPALMAASRMTLHGFRRIPVVAGEKLIGIVSLGDIHKAIFKRELDLDS